MKKIPDLLRMPPSPKDMADLDRLAGLPPTEHSFGSLVDDVARKFAHKLTAAPLPAAGGDDDRPWRIHKLFATLHDKYGRPFRMFVGDLLDVLLGGLFQAKFLGDLMEERSRHPAKTAESAPEGRGNLDVPAPVEEEPSVQIGGEAKLRARNFLKRKNLLASIFLDPEEFPAFQRLLKQISLVCREEIRSMTGVAIPTVRDERKAFMKAVHEELRNEITRAGLVRAWLLLDADDFQDLEWIFNETRNLGLVRPNFYEELDKAYREAKKMLQLLVTEFEAPGAQSSEKREAVHQYLTNIMEVYTHHHFVLKHFNQTRPLVSRAEFEGKKREWQERHDALRSEAQKLREEVRALAIERDEAVAEARALRQENVEFGQKLQKLDPVEVQKQLRAMETRVNQIQREQHEIIEEDTELRTALRQVDAENQKMVQKLRDLHAIPDEMAKSVEDLLKDKRVVVFGGVGRDHYLAVLKEAGVKDADYEWYEGYHTISQARTAEIVGRCHVIVVVTSYAGHLHTWQTRNAVGPGQHLFLIHSSGAGSLRQAIIERLNKPTGGAS